MTDIFPENLQSGVAVLADADNNFDAETWTVNGVALSEGTITHGGSGRRRIWPESALRPAADMLEGRPIVKNYHGMDGQATADEVIGQITETGYQNGVGIVFEGEISDESIIRKVSNNYLDVSVVAGISQERYDEERDAFIVEEVAGFRDIAVVAEGADQNAEIQVGQNPAIAALSRATFSGSWDALQRSEARTPSYSGTRSGDSWDRPSLSAYIDGYYDQADADPDDTPSQWGDLPQEARDWISARTLLGDSNASGSDSGISYPVVHPDDDLSESGLQSARSMAGNAPSDQAADSIRSVTETLLENEFGHDFDDDSNESESNAAQFSLTSQTDALQEDGNGDGDGDTRLDVWSDFLADLSGSVEVGEIDFGHLHRLLATEIPGSDISDVAGVLPSDDFEEGFDASDARELISGLVDSEGEDDDDSEGDSESENEEDDEEDDEEETESNSALFAPAPNMSLDEALEHEFELTGTTPDRCHTVKSGANTVNIDENSVARDVLDIKETVTYDISEDEFARDALGLSDDRDPETVDLNEAPVERHLLGLDVEDEDIEETVAHSYDEHLQRRPDQESAGDSDIRSDTDEREPEMIDLNEAPVERHLLGLSDEESDESPADKSFGEHLRAGESVELDISPSERRLLGIEVPDDGEDDSAGQRVKSYGDHLQEAVEAAADDTDGDEDVERVNLDESPVERHLLGLDDPEDPDTEEETDVATKSYGRRVRQQLNGADPDPETLSEDGDAEGEGEGETEIEDDTETIDLENSPVERHLLGLDDEDEEDERPADSVVKSYGERVQEQMQVMNEDDDVERIDIYEDPVASQALGVEGDAESEAEADD